MNHHTLPERKVVMAATSPALSGEVSWLTNATMWSKQWKIEEIYCLCAVTKIWPEFSHIIGAHLLCYSHVRPAVFIHLFCYDKIPQTPGHGDRYLESHLCRGRGGRITCISEIKARLDNLVRYYHKNKQNNRVFGSCIPLIPALHRER